MAFPDLAVHCISQEELLAGGDTVTRTPELVIEILGEETAVDGQRPCAPKALLRFADRRAGPIIAKP